MRCFTGFAPAFPGAVIHHPDSVYAHINGEHCAVETIAEHLERVHYYAKIMADNNGLEEIFANFGQELLPKDDQVAQDLFKKMISGVIDYHDIGKIGANFQAGKMENQCFKPLSDTSNYSYHAPFSTLAYINHYMQEITGSVRETEPLLTLLLIMFLNAYVISKHHGSLDDFDSFLEALKDTQGHYQSLLKDGEFWHLFKGEYREGFRLNAPTLSNALIHVEKIRKEIGENQRKVLAAFIYPRLLLSVLLKSDHYATTDYMNGAVLNLEKTSGIDPLFNAYNQSDLVQHIRKYERANERVMVDKITEINDLRSELFLEAEIAFEQLGHKGISLLEAPTGIGKSNVSYNLGLRAAIKHQAGSIKFVYPYNNLVEQNRASLDKIFENTTLMDQYVSVFNSITPIKEKLATGQQVPGSVPEDNAVDYQNSFLDHQFLNDPLVLTTNVSFFNTLFGTSKKDIFPLCQLTNNVVVIDEIQCVKSGLWKDMTMFLNAYSEFMNIRFIIMSATLPDLSMLLDTKAGSLSASRFTRLIKEPEQYFKHPLYLGRTKVDFSLYSKHKTRETDLINHLAERAAMGDANILMLFIKKRTAKRIYQQLKNSHRPEFGNKKILVITSDDNLYQRNQIINRIKAGEKDIILIGTQTIEAGIDIDMDIGYKNISILDSEIQFIGRINREGKLYGRCSHPNAGRVYIFNLDEPEEVYKSDYRTIESLTLKDEEMKKSFEENNYSVYQEKLIMEIKAYSSSKTNKGGIINEVKRHNFKAVADHMRLIDESNRLTLFMNISVTLDGGKMLHGSDVWEKFRELLRDHTMGYAEKKIHLSKVKAQMVYFLYEVPFRDKLKYFITDQIGEICYINDADGYFEDGVFLGVDNSANNWDSY